MESLKKVVKQTRFYIALSLIVQAISSIFMVIFFLYKNKKNTAAAFSALGVTSGICGIVILSKLVREQRGETLLQAIDDLYFDDEENADIDLEDIPVDETADETEFD